MFYMYFTGSGTEGSNFLKMLHQQIVAVGHGFTTAISFLLQQQFFSIIFFIDEAVKMIHDLGQNKYSSLGLLFSVTSKNFFNDFVCKFSIWYLFIVLHQKLLVLITFNIEQNFY